MVASAMLKGGYSNTTLQYAGVSSITRTCRNRQLRMLIFRRARGQAVRALYGSLEALFRDPVSYVGRAVAEGDALCFTHTEKANHLQIDQIHLLQIKSDL